MRIALIELISPINSIRKIRVISVIGISPAGYVRKAINGKFTAIHVKKQKRASLSKL